MGHPVLEYPHCPAHVGGNRPPIQPKENNHIYQHLENIPTPTCLPLPVTISLANRPTFLYLPEVSHHHGPVIIQLFHETAKILKRLLLLHALI